MRRLALVFSVVLLVGVFAVAAAPALAGQTDWAVNGVPLAPGQEVPVKFAATTPMELIAPAQGIDITCTTFKGKGTLVGGTQGTGSLTSVKMSHCTEAGPVLVKVRIEFEGVTIQTDTNRPPGAEYTIEWGLLGQCFRKGHTELRIAGEVDSFGPSPAGGNAVEFPQPSLPATTLTIGGSPAELVGRGAFTLPKHATLSQVEL